MIVDKNLLNTLKKIIKPELICESSENEISLTEKDANYECQITNLIGDSLIIQIKNVFGGSSKFFISDTKLGIQKNADYFVFVHQNSIKYLFIIELKRTLRDDNYQYITLQLKASACLFKYCQAIGKIFLNNDSFLDGYKIRFVSLNKLGKELKYEQKQEQKPPKQRW